MNPKIRVHKFLWLIKGSANVTLVDEDNEYASVCHSNCSDCGSDGLAR